MWFRSTVAACVLAALASSAGPVSAAPAAFTYQSLLENANPLGLTVTNFGLFGNNYISRAASFEFPYGSGYEHLAHAGLWVGAQAVDGTGAFTGVTTGALDVSVGTSTANLTEWTPMSDLTRRSSSPASPYFDPAAASDLDVLAGYDDHTVKTASGNPEAHRPMGVTVRQGVYAWSAPELRDALFLRFVVSNSGASTLTGVWVGLYAELASGDKNSYACWPPASVCGATGGWFSKKWIAWDDTLRLLREHYCFAPPVPGGCNLGTVPYWVGLKLLTRPAAGQSTTLATWSFAPGEVSRDQDTERYALMSAGTIADLSTPAMQPGTGDPVEVLALGPFASLAPGDSATVDFALVGGASIDSLQAVSNRAQRFHDTGEFDQATPVAAALVSAEADADGVRLVFATGDAGGRATLERRTEAADWTALAALTADGEGRVSYADHDVAPGARYAYRLRVGAAEPTAPVWITVPMRAAFALHGARPNPLAAGDPVVAFTLPSAAPATLALFDLAGRRVRALVLDAPSPGEHALRLTGPAPLAPGVYTVRLTQGARVATARLSVVR